MAKLEYKLEYNYNDGTASDSAVFVHFRINPPIYQAYIDKEDYDVLPPELKHPFTTGLFEIAGVTELSIRAYRIWYVKSPVYLWNEVNLPVLYFVANWFGFDGLEELLGSANIEGNNSPGFGQRGVVLPAQTNRRKL